MFLKGAQLRHLPSLSLSSIIDFINYLVNSFPLFFFPPFTPSPPIHSSVSTYFLFFFGIVASLDTTNAHNTTLTYQQAFSYSVLHLTHASYPITSTSYPSYRKPSFVAPTQAFDSHRSCLANPYTSSRRIASHVPPCIIVLDDIHTNYLQPYTTSSLSAFCIAYSNRPSNPAIPLHSRLDSPIPCLIISSTAFFFNA